jgi:DNA polymerase I-like protein with 3'-5' exonuclease and polymerase domains
MLIHFVDTLKEAQSACKLIKTKAIIGLDIEMDSSYAASLLQIAVSTAEVYVFDATKLGQSLFDASCLLPILCDPRITKLCYDCRGDSETLFRKHGAKIYGLYDLQIVYTSLFQEYEDPHLKGIGRAVRVALPFTTSSAVFSACKMRMKRSFGAGEDKFVRPLSSEALQYCAEDAVILMRLYDALHFHVDAEEVLLLSSIRAKRHIFRSTARPMYVVDFARLLQTCC